MFKVRNKSFTTSPMDFAPVNLLSTLSLFEVEHLSYNLVIIVIRLEIKLPLPEGITHFF